MKRRALDVLALDIYEYLSDPTVATLEFIPTR